MVNPSAPASNRKHPRKIAIIHDWLAIYTGSERVVEQMIHLYPEADLFSLVDFVEPDQRSFLQGKQVYISPLQHFPFARKKFRNYLAVMPFLIEQFDLSVYDLVISSSHAVAKGVITGPDQLHLSYVHTPMRYAWDMQYEYLQEPGIGHGLKQMIIRLMLHYIRLWDARSSNGVDAMAANSEFIARRIWKIYRREAQVIYPPVDIQNFRLCEQKENFYLAASRMVPYKKLDLIVQAFNGMPDKKLVVIGDGALYPTIRKLAASNIEVLGGRSTEEMVSYMQRAKAYIFAAQEDFGITPMEAQACGTPVIAYGRGGVRETVRGLDHPQPTGVFYDEQSSAAIQDAVYRFEEAKESILPANCRTNAERFSEERFCCEFSSFVEENWEKFQAQQRIIY